MRISDWSSDVCSSYLVEALALERDEQRAAAVVDVERAGVGLDRVDQHVRALQAATGPLGDARERQRVHALPSSIRSEEHTSELQSLMRISYAVFCLKKKNRKHAHDKT